MLFFSADEFVSKLTGGLLEAAQGDVDPESCILEAESEAAGYFQPGFDLTMVPGMKSVVHRLSLWNLASLVGIAEEHEIQYKLYKGHYDSAVSDLERMGKEFKPAAKTAHSPRGVRNTPKVETW